MKILLLCAVVAALGAAFLAALGPQGEQKSAAALPEPAGRMLAHDVYFTLSDNSDEAKAALVAACKKHLSAQPGTVWFAAGPLVAENQREVNQRDFDVALHLVFKDKASHDKYQSAPEHHKFVEENSKSWKTVRVFDSYVDAFSHGDVEMQPGR